MGLTAQPFCLGHHVVELRLRNALCESFFASLECELIDRRIFKSHTEGRMAVFQYIEGWYNPRRRHFALDCQSPIDYEQMYLEAA